VERTAGGGEGDRDVGWGRLRTWLAMISWFQRKGTNVLAPAPRCSSMLIPPPSSSLFLILFRALVGAPSLSGANLNQRPGHGHG